jgi:hypothetical protein
LPPCATGPPSPCYIVGDNSCPEMIVSPSTGLAADAGR